MNAKRLYVHRSRMDEVVAGLSARLEKAVLGYGLDEGTDDGPAAPAGRRRTFVAGDHRRRRKAAGAEVREFGELPGGDLDEAATSCGRPSSSTPTRRCASSPRSSSARSSRSSRSTTKTTRSPLANDTWAGLCALGLDGGPDTRHRGRRPAGRAATSGSTTTAPRASTCAPRSAA